MANIFGFVIAALSAWIVKVLKTPADHYRAALLSTLANDAAAVVVNLMPNAAWAELLAAVVQRVAGGSSVPTQNSLVIETAATAALVRLGKTQAAKPLGR